MAPATATMAEKVSPATASKASHSKGYFPCDRAIQKTNRMRGYAVTFARHLADARLVIAVKKLQQRAHTTPVFPG